MLFHRSYGEVRCFGGHVAPIFDKVAANCNVDSIGIIFLWSKVDHNALGWEFQFLVPISGTPIVSGIPIPFLIPKITVGYFLKF